MYVIKGGCGTRHPQSYSPSRPNGLDSHVLLILRSKGDYYVGDDHFEMEPGYAIMIAPNVPYHYNNPYGEYIDDWMHIGLDPFEKMPEELPMNRPFKLYDHETCSNLIRQLLWEFTYTDSRYLKENISSLFTVLMNHLIAASRNQENIEEASPYMERLKDIRFRMQHTLMEHHTIHEHAADIGISDSHFQHLYSELFGISFQQDLIHMRVKNAEFALQTTNMTIAEIAEMCGYENEVHFFRQFKKINGITPAKYRKAQHAINKF